MENRVLIINLGTPDSMLAWYKEILKEFYLIGECKVNPIYGNNIKRFILNLRPSKTAKAYKEIWWKNNIPPIHVLHCKQIEKVSDQYRDNLIIDFAMRYEISIKSKAKITRNGCENLVILLISAIFSSNHSQVCDEVYRTNEYEMATILKNYTTLWVKSSLYWCPVNSINQKLEKINWKPDLPLLFIMVFQRNILIKVILIIVIVTRPQDQYLKSLNQLKLNYISNQIWPQECLNRHDKTLESLPKEGVKNVLAICPGFSSDCVETLEEILIQGKESFIEAGGENFDMIPCLNDSDVHIKLIKNLIQKNM